MCKGLVEFVSELAVEGGSGSPTVFSKSVLTIRTAGNGFAHMLH